MSLCYSQNELKEVRERCIYATSSHVTLNSIAVIFVASSYVCTTWHAILAAVQEKKVGKMHENRLNPDCILSIIQHPSFSDYF